VAGGRVISNGMTQSPHDHRFSEGRRSLGERRARERRVLSVGLAVSVLLHVLVLVVLGDWLIPDRGPRPALSPGPLVLEPPTGLRAVELVEVPEPEVGTPERPRPRPSTTVAPAAEPVAAAAPDTAAAPADDITAADRLAPRVVDPRLWRPMVILPRDPTIEDVEARVAAAIELLSDSALAEAEAAIRARDWTLEDGSGGRWGISPGQIHLGSLTLPLPIFIPLDVEGDQDLQRWYELDQALDRTRVLDTIEDRVRAIRERRERERAEARETAENGGG
jgi:hypothetical protein